MKVVALLQARSSSTRLPGKIFEDIRGKPMLQRIIERIRSPWYDVVVATSTLAGDDRVAALCSSIGVDCFRGSEDDVLGRLCGAACQRGADVVIRLTGDNPLVDRSFVEKLLDEFVSSETDYVSTENYPVGLSAEIVRFASLAIANEHAESPVDREHVTSYIYRRPELFNVQRLQAPKDWSWMRWTVDTPDDLRFVRTVYDRLGDSFDWADVVALIEREPELQSMNAHVRQKVLGE